MWLPSFNTGSAPGQTHAGGRLQHLGQRIKITLFSSPVMRCTICHAELTPAEFGERACSDSAGCCLRRYSQRCW